LTFDIIRDKNKKIHFIGIGGISMSGLADILVKNGFSVSGSDMKSSPIIEKLTAEGVEFHLGHSESNVKNADLIVYTAAISPDNPELQMGRELNIPLMDRAEFLGHLMRGHKYNIAVSGTHGKTTTTSMISHIIMEAALDPTILVGGELDLINGNVRTGNSEYFITEACEYKASFLKFYPYIGIILNVDADHLDYFKDIDHIKDTFQQFVDIIPEEGYAVGYADDSRVKEILMNATCNSCSYGLQEGDIRAEGIDFNDKGCASFDVVREGIKLFRISLSVPGKHNILNALASIATALILNIPEEAIVRGLAGFKGTHKRFEVKGSKNGITVVDDYAHHPTEIKATLSTAKSYPHQRIVCVFQPHTYTRTLSLFDDFVNSFFDADELILADIYAAREKDTGVISSQMLGDKIREKGFNCKNFHSFEEICEYLKNSLRSGDLLLTVGAGDIVKVGEMYLMD
jgi:UDP-N-acetylmuramate--alanine ligase